MRFLGSDGPRFKEEGSSVAGIPFCVDSLRPPRPGFFDPIAQVFAPLAMISKPSCYHPGGELKDALYQRSLVDVSSTPTSPV